MNRVARVVVTENQELTDLPARLGVAAGVDPEEAESLLALISRRLTEELHLEESPVKRRGDRLSLDGVAGLMKITSELEIEVAPKFLGTDWPEWREDFLFLAQLSSYGEVLPADSLFADVSRATDLPTVLGNIMVSQFERHRRRPLRTYRPVSAQEFALDGSWEPEELLIPEADGFNIERLSLEMANQYNAVISAAARKLTPEVADSDTRQSLGRLSAALGPQPPLQRLPVALPQRHRRWGPLFRLSSQVLHGFGLDLTGNRYDLAPGFLLRTAKAWEDLLGIAARLSSGSRRVNTGKRYKLGLRNGEDFHTKPDLVIEGSSLLVVDAKYKTRLDRTLSIEASDVYEGLAFLRATGGRRLILAYPADAHTTPRVEVGTCTPFERLQIDDCEILGVRVEVRGISRPAALHEFSRTLGTFLKGQGN